MNGACLTTAKPSVCVCLPEWSGSNRTIPIQPPAPDAKQTNYPVIVRVFLAILHSQFLNRAIIGATVGGVLVAAVAVTLVIIAMKKGVCRGLYNKEDKEGWMIN